MRIAVWALVILAACRGENSEEGHIRSIHRGYYGAAESSATEESLEIEIPKGFVIDSIEDATVIDDRGRRHKPTQIALSTSEGPNGRQQVLTVRVALDQPEVLRSIEVGGYVIDVSNSRMRRR